MSKNTSVDLLGPRSDHHANSAGQQLAGTSPVIIITHFINPHRFWFKYEASVLNGNPPLEQLELELHKHASLLNQRLLYHSGYEPDIGELVVVKHLTWSKWIRARVDMRHSVSTGTKFVLWAIDHGVPFETRSKWIRPLPKHLAERHVVSVFQAGIANIVPATRRLNYVNMSNCTVRTEHWSADAVRTFEEIVANVETIRFTRTLMLEDPDDEHNHIFGQLEFTTYSGIQVDPAVALQEFNYAVSLTEKRFDNDIQTEKTRCTPRWLDNELVKRINDNGTTEHSMRPPPGFDGESDFICGVKKVSDWQMRNQHKAPNHGEAAAELVECYDTTRRAKRELVIDVNSKAEKEAEAVMVDDPPKLMHFRVEDDVSSDEGMSNIIVAGLKKVTTSVEGSSIAGDKSISQSPIESKVKSPSSYRYRTNGRKGKSPSGQANSIGSSTQDKASLPGDQTPANSLVTNVAPSKVTTGVSLQQKLQKRSQLLANLKANEKPISPNQDVSPKSGNTTAKVPEKKLTQFQRAAKQDQW